MNYKMLIASFVVVVVLLLPIIIRIYRIYRSKKNSAS